MLVSAEKMQMAGTDNTIVSDRVSSTISKYHATPHVGRVEVNSCLQPCMSQHPARVVSLKVFVMER